MTPEAQRIAIAEACGWKSAEGVIKNGFWVNGIYVSTILSDLNAMHEAEKVLTEDQKWDYGNRLAQIVREPENVAFGDPRNKKFPLNEFGLYELAHLTAAQRAEAFLRTLDLWVES